MSEKLLGKLPNVLPIVYKWGVEPNLISILTDGDMRTIGAANSVLELVHSQPDLILVLVDGLMSDSPGVRMRSADVLEKLSVEKAYLLEPYKCEFLSVARNSEQKEVQWHIGFILPRLDFDEAETDAIEAILDRYLESKTSAIVRVSAVEGLARLALAFPDRYERCVGKIFHAMEGGPPSVIARGKKMLKLLTKQTGES